MKIVHLSDIHYRPLTRHKEYQKHFEIFFNQLKTEVKPDHIAIIGDIVHSRCEVSPELYDNLVWFFNECISICDTHIICGNHDMQMANKSRLDALSPIIEAINSPRLHFYKYSGVYNIDKGYNFCVFSILDEEKWPDIKPVPNEVNICLMHNGINGGINDEGFDLGGDLDVSYFNDYDITLLGDYHLRQHLAYKEVELTINEDELENYPTAEVILNEKMRKIKIKIKQPYISYSGSPIPQNYGETQPRGYLVWDIRGSNDFQVTEKNIPQLNPYITLNFDQNIENTLKNIEQYPQGSRFRIRYNQEVTHVDIKQIINEIKLRNNAIEVVWKSDYKVNSNIIKTKSITLLKQDLYDYNSHFRLLKEYFKDVSLEKTEWDQIEKITKKYIIKLIEQEGQHPKSNRWSIKNLEFDNIFGYGPGNYINFEKLNNIVGIFGPNRIGKSSILAAIMYCLYGKTDRDAIKNQDIVNVNLHHCRAKIIISIDDKFYAIERQTHKKLNKKGINSTSTLVFQEVDSNGIEIENLSDTMKIDVEPLIRAKVGSFEDFALTSFISQGDVNRFIKEGATKRKAIINRFLGLDIFEKIHLLAKEDVDVLKAQMKNLTEKNWDVSISQFNEEKAALKQSNTNIETELSIVRNELQTKQIALSNALQGSIGPVVTQVDVNAQLGIIEGLKTKLELNRVSVTSIQVEISLSEDKISKIEEIKIKFPIETLKTKLKEQNEMEKTLMSLKHQFEREEQVLKSQEKSVQKLNMVPCGDQFQTCMFIKDSHIDKSKINHQRELVTNTKLELDKLYQTYQKIKGENLEEKINKYSELDNKILNLKNDIANKHITMTKNQSKINELEEELDKANKNLVSLQSKLSTQNKDIDNIKEEIVELNNKINGLDAKKIINAENIGRVSNEIINQEKEKKFYNELRFQWRIYELYLDAIGKKGIPNQILKNQIPSINKEITNLLAGITNYTIELQTEMENNNLDIFINYGGIDRRIIETCSGMEKTFAAIAIRAALLNSATNVPTCDILFADESFDGIDKENSEAAYKLFELLKKSFKTICLISHRIEVKEIVDMFIDINKENNFSKVIYE